MLSPAPLLVGRFLLPLFSPARLLFRLALGQVLLASRLHIVRLIALARVYCLRGRALLIQSLRLGHQARRYGATRLPDASPRFRWGSCGGQLGGRLCLARLGFSC